MEPRSIIILANIIAKRMRFKRLEKINPCLPNNNYEGQKCFPYKEKSEQLASIPHEAQNPNFTFS
jgi:hypothetical protein